VKRARQAHPDLEMVITLAQEFASLVRGHDADAFDTWLERATTSGLDPFRNFAKSVRQDAAAVRAALTLPWSNGPVKGYINRLKLLKRQAYGRAKLDLLRVRLLGPEVPSTRLDHQKLGRAKVSRP
jgi:transposase